MRSCLTRRKTSNEWAKMRASGSSTKSATGECEKDDLFVVRLDGVD